MSAALAAVLSLIPAALLVLSFVYYLLVARRGFDHADAQAKGGRRLLGLVLRNYWYWLHGPLEQVAIRFRVHPDVLSLGGLVMAVLAAFAFARGWFALGGWLIVMGGTFDILDGRVARATGKANAAGAFLDSVLDRYADFFLLLGLVLFYGSGAGLYLGLAALLGTFVVSYARARAEGLGAECRDGLLQRAERMLFLASAGILTPIVGWLTGVAYGSLMLYVLGGLAVFTNLTALGRLRQVYRHLHDRKLTDDGTPLSERT